MTDKSKKLLGITLGVIIVVVVLLLLYDYGTYQEGSVSDIAFPAEVQGLKLGQVISGPRAIAMISKLHGTDIVIDQGYIANYGNSRSRIMVWVSESGSKKEASQLFAVMDRKISAAASSVNAPFKERRVFVKNGKRVIAVKGMGMENYYYKSGVEVYWIAAAGIDPISALDEIMKKLP
ncbi:MAG TPA: hypothetical protein VNT57_07265 [Desulfobacteria bacterium]|nr:hypothetical protein [Desulfobacteria bacterium]